MTEIDIAGLRALAQACNGPMATTTEWMAFRKATGPSTVLALCDALEAAENREDMHKETARLLRRSVADLEVAIALEAAEHREQAREIERLQTGIAPMEQATVRMAWQTGEFKARARTAERLVEEKDREIERLRAIARAACEMAQEGIGLANPLRLGGIINILDGLATGEFDEDTAEWVRDALSGASDVNHGIMMAVHGPGGVNSRCPCSPSDDICICEYDCECRERHPHIYDPHEGYLVGRDAQERKDACCGVNSQSTAGEAQG